MKYTAVVIVILLILLLVNGITNDPINNTVNINRHLNKNNVNAFVHIGPPKTGTTHIQSFLQANSETLDDRGYKVILQKSIKDDVNHLLKAAIDNNKFQKHLIISAESLSMDNDPYIWLQFLHGYNITIIATYRETISRTLSGCHQRMSMGRILDFNCLKYLGSVENYKLENELDKTFLIARKIGVLRIKLIDYYGLLAAHEEIVHVFLCQIIETMCIKTDNQKKIVSDHDNQSLSPTWIYLITAFTRVARNNNCQKSFFTFYHDDFYKFKSAYNNAADGTNFLNVDKLPRTTKNLTKSVHNSQIIDMEFRKSILQKTIMYGNVTANKIMSEEFTIMTELDGEKLDTDKKFIAVLQKVYNQFKC